MCDIPTPNQANSVTEHSSIHSEDAALLRHLAAFTSSLLGCIPYVESLSIFQDYIFRNNLCFLLVLLWFKYFPLCLEPLLLLNYGEILP